MVHYFKLSMSRYNLPTSRVILKAFIILTVAINFTQFIFLFKDKLVTRDSYYKLEKWTKQTLTDTVTRTIFLQTCNCTREVRIPSIALNTRNYAETTCGREAFERGAHQKVVSFTFFGKQEGWYWDGIKINLDLLDSHYPGWVMRVYHDLRPRKPGLNQLCEIACKYPNLDLCDVRRNPAFGDLSAKYPLMWRFLPMADSSVDMFMSRDLDSRFTARETSAVVQWLESNFTFHIMRDHPLHGVSIVGCCWGAKVSDSRFLMKILWERMMRSKHALASRFVKQPDQAALHQIVWPLAWKNSLQHDSYLCQKYPGSSPFPTRRRNESYNFVGAVNTMSIMIKCPKTCRPYDHTDWLYC